jgi:hypothetical protein
MDVVVEPEHDTAGDRDRPSGDRAGVAGGTAPSVPSGGAGSFGGTAASGVVRSSSGRAPSWPMWTACAGSGVVAVAGFLPWARSGSRQRSSFDLARLADRLDLVDGRWTSILLALWAMIPLLAALTLLAAVFERPRPVLASAGLASALGVTGVALAARTPLPLSAGVWVALGGAAVGLVGITALGIGIIRLKYRRVG